MSPAGEVKPDEVAVAVWAEIEKLRDEIPKPEAGGLYPNSDAAKAFAAADAAVASLCAVPREDMLQGFTQLVEGSRLNDLLDALVSSKDHPALMHSCLMVLCGVASLKQAHEEITRRRDVLEALLSALASPTTHRISPEGAVGDDDLQVNPSVGAAICLNSLLVSCGGLKEETIKVWQELDALSAITSALEAHAVFEGGGDEDRGAERDGRNSSDGTAGRSSRGAFLRLLAERREWVARSLAMAANASPTDLSGGAASPAPVTINNLLVNSLAHSDLLGAFTRRTPVRLRAQAVAAARQCETEGTFAPGFALQLTRLLGLGGQQELNRRMADHTVQKIKNKEAARAANIKCSRPTCGQRQGSASGGCKFKVCSRCQSAMYCSAECQKAHWREGHKAECRKK
ncbi:unnamed protein product [Scytosiphon promiscuus]